MYTETNKGFIDVIEHIPMDKKVSLRVLTGYGREAHKKYM